MKKNLIILFLLLLIVSASAESAEGLFSANEELVYEVSFMGISIGEVKLAAIGAETLKGREAYHVRATLKTHNNIPFLKANIVYDSWIDKSLKFSHKLEARIIHDSGNKELFITDMSYPEIMFRKSINNKTTEEKSIKVGGRICEGLTLIYIIRQMAGSGKSIIIPTIQGYDTSATKLTFEKAKNLINIDAFDYKTPSFYIAGKGNWTGVYGVTGDFRAWVSADNMRVPLKAQVKLYLGMVNIELKKWKRKSWKPLDSN